MKRFLSSLFSILIPVISYGSVAFDNSNTNDAASGISFGTTITVGNNPNRVLVVTVEISDGLSVSSVSGAGITWPGSAVGTQAGAGTTRAEIWCGVGPTTGSQTVTVTFSGSMTDFEVVNIESLYNASQASPCSNYTGANLGSGSNATVTVTTTSGDGAVAALMDASGSVTVSNCTTTIDTNFTNGGGTEFLATHCIASGSSTVFSFTNSNGKVDNGVDIAPAAGAAAGANKIKKLEQLDEL